MVLVFLLIGFVVIILVSEHKLHIVFCTSFSHIIPVVVVFAFSFNCRRECWRMILLVTTWMKKKRSWTMMTMAGKSFTLMSSGFLRIRHSSVPFWVSENTCNPYRYNTMKSLICILNHNDICRVVCKTLILNSTHGLGRSKLIENTWQITVK